jgi:hypothetical protein
MGMELQVPDDIQRLNKKDYAKKPHSVYGIASVICGVVAFLFFFIYPFLIYPIFEILLPPPDINSFSHVFAYLTYSRDIYAFSYTIPIFFSATLAIAYGSIDLFIKKSKDIDAKIGLGLGLLDLIIALFVFVTLYYIAI